MKMELLAPAGNYESFIQAINNGADAIYLAGKNFNARTFANNFTIDEIASLVKYAHIRDVKIYVTVNTLIKDSEIMDALKFVEQLYKANVDAILVQDIGLINIVRKAYPDLELHASTQMNCTCVNDAKVLKELGFKRIVLARECSIDTIKEIKKNVDIEIEVFCHGALCMSYSGNCLMSSLIGGRSGNRGKCAQSCRQEYTLEYGDVNSSEKKIIDTKYYLSCKDLDTLEYVKELQKIGVDSIKIEGRGKESEYVATVTKWYRNALDNNLNSYDIENGKKELKLVFNRKFTKGYIFNETNSDFTNIDTVNHLGLNIGKIIKADKQFCYIKLNEDVNINDALRIVDEKWETKDALIINNMYLSDEFFRQGDLIKSAKKNSIVKIRIHNENLKAGFDVLKTKDSKIIDSVNNGYDKKIDINGKIFLKDNLLCLELRHNDISIVSKSSISYEEAKNEDMKNRILEQISKIGDTPFEFASLEYVGKSVFLPIKVINELRRDAISALEEKLIDSKKKNYHYNKFYTNVLEYSNEKRLYAKVRTKAQANACVDAGIKFIISENKDLVDEMNKVNSDIHFIYLAPRLSKEFAGYAIDEVNNDKISSVYLNVMNIFAVNFMHENGVNIVGISPELSKKEIVELVNRYKNTFKKMPNLMMQVYGRYEMMLMKHCPINKALGLDNKGCLECERHQYYLKDKKEYEFPLIRTINCNVKLLNSRTTSLIDYMKEIIKIGINNLLIDFTLEGYEETLRVANNYLDCFKNEKNGIENNPYTTHGAYENGIE